MSCTAVALHFFFVLDDLAVELVDQGIDSRIHVVIAGIGEDVIARHVDGGLCLLLIFFYGEDDVHVRHMVEVSLELGDFFLLRKRALNR